MRRTMLTLLVCVACDQSEPADCGDLSGGSSTTEPAADPDPQLPADEVACNVAAMCIAQVCEYPLRGFSLGEVDQQPFQDALEECSSECADVEPECGTACLRPWDVALETVEPCLRTNGGAQGRCWENPTPVCPAFWGPPQ